MRFERFQYQDFLQISDKTEKLGIKFPFSPTVDALSSAIVINNINLPNRIAIQPMEGCDANSDGSPGELMLRRYRRFAKSGASVIWTEANAVSPAFRSSDGQLYLTEENVSAFSRMTDMIRELCLKEHGFTPLLITQATHSGRYTKTNNVPSPVIAWRNPHIEGSAPLDKSCIVTDDALRRAEEQFGRFARLAKKAGFDGVDIKCSHFYLSSELLSAYERPGPYGGSFENRTRFLMNCMRAAKPEADSCYFLTCRLNAYDGFPYPYGFGVRPGGGLEPDYTEANRLVAMLHEEIGIDLVNITLGNPYFNPYINRPYDLGPVQPTEHPFVGVSRMIESARSIKAANPGVTVLASGLTYMREFSGGIAAGAMEEGAFDMIGFGRLALANPDFVEKLLHNTMTRRECCVTCTGCSYLMRMFMPAGCIVHDNGIYRKATSVKRTSTAGRE